MNTVLTAEQHFLFIVVTSTAAMVGGLLLWGGFVLMGWISRRYEQAFGLPTHWLVLVLSPAGLFFYLVLQSIASLRHVSPGPVELWIGYALLSWSAMFCAWGVIRFWRILAFLEKER